jgi:hypothetical protein
MKQQLVVTRRYTVLQQTEKLHRFLIEQHLSVLRVHENVRTSNLLFANSILTEGVFVTERYSGVGVLV